MKKQHTGLAMVLQSTLSKPTTRQTEVQKSFCISPTIQRILRRLKIKDLLTKYNRFNQIPIKFGTKKINDPDFTPKTTKDKDGKETTEPHKQIDVDNIINNTNPAWTKTSRFRG